MLISSLAPPDSPYYMYGNRQPASASKRDRDDDWVQLSVTRIIETRGTEMYPVAGIKHVCSREKCLPLSETDLIAAKRLPANARPLHSSVYVCRFHEVHICTMDDCNAYIGTRDGVCPLTGVYHRHTEGEKAFVMPEKRTAHFKRNGVKGMNARDANQHDEEQAEEAAESKRRRMQLSEYSRKNAFGALFGRTEAGVTSPPPPPPPPPAPAAVAVAVVVIEEEKVVVMAPKRPRVAAKSKRRRLLYEDAAAIISQLLYSDERKKINEQKREKNEICKQRVKKAYYDDREGVTIPIMTEMMNKIAPFDMKIPHMRILERDEQRIKHYANIVLQSWKIVTESPWGANNPGFRFEAHTLSVMYKMRKGLTIGKMALLPQDRYLYSLPLRNDLPFFGKGYHSKVVTSGMKNIVAAYESAIAANWAPERLVLQSLIS